MESVASNSSTYHHNPRLRSHSRFTDRLVRALHHHLRLLDRSGPNFFVLGATGNVYTVTLSTNPSCTCPDRTIPCKHILFILIRVLGISLEDSCLRRRALRPLQLSHVLCLPTLPEALAGVSIRQRFHQLLLQPRQQGFERPKIEIEEGTSCPICLDEMGKEEKIVACGTCRNHIHEDCLLKWKRSVGRRSTRCVICRSRWKNRLDQQENKYLNLGAFVSVEDDYIVNDNDGGGLCGGLI